MTDDASDLIDPEAPADGGDRVDTAAYAREGALATRPAVGEVLDRAVDALLRLAADRPWSEVSLRDIAREAGVGFADLYAKAPGKAALLSRLSDRYDRHALAAAEADDQPQVKDRLFEAFMARLEAMEPDRAVLIAIGRAEGLTLAPLLPRTARALAEASGVDTGGARGAVRALALTRAWARTLQVWRDDEGALNRTMAEIDKLLTGVESRLKRLRIGL